MVDDLHKKSIHEWKRFVKGEITLDELLTILGKKDNPEFCEDYDPTEETIVDMFDGRVIK